MQQLIIAFAVGALVGILSIGVPFFICWRLRERTFRSLSEAYERIIAKGDERLRSADQAFIDYRNREYAEHNLPPEGTDMLQEHKDRREEIARRAEERRINPRPPSKIGVVDQGQHAMDLAVAMQHK